jgi:rSAM/selenodomain-associated transferase 2
MTKLISIIIPTLNEEEYIEECLRHVVQRCSEGPCEIIVAEGGSQDGTQKIAERWGAQVILCEKAQRAYQLNCGAEIARGEILYFLHADALLPPKYDEHIRQSLKVGHDFGIFAYDFYPDNRWLRINASFTRRKYGFSGGGDQSLYMSRSVFESTGGFDDNLEVMEDFEYFHRLRSKFKWEVIQSPLKVSARKYQRNGYLKVQLVNFAAVLAYRMGVPTMKIKRWYCRQLQ